LEDWQCQCRRKEWEWRSLWMKWTSATTTSEKRKNRLRGDCLYLFWSGTLSTNKHIPTTLGQGSVQASSFKFHCTKRFLLSPQHFIYLFTQTSNISFIALFNTCESLSHDSVLFALRKRHLWILPSTLTRNMSHGTNPYLPSKEPLYGWVPRMVKGKSVKKALVF
jgi:hypothetical protein